MVLGLENLKLLRINLKNAQVIEDIQIPKIDKGNDQITALYLDPSGRHLLVSTELGYNFYVNQSMTRAQHLARLKGIHVTAVAFPRLGLQSTKRSTGSFLVGAYNGNVYEVEIESKEGDREGGSGRKGGGVFRIIGGSHAEDDVKRLKLVFTVPSRDIDASSISQRSTSTHATIHSAHLQSQFPDRAITGLAFEQFLADSRKYVVFISTHSRLYQAIGRIPSPNAFTADARKGGSASSGANPTTGIFESLFASSKQKLGCYELPNPSEVSTLDFLYPVFQNQQVGTATKVAWLTGSGTYYGQLSYGSQSSGDSVLQNAVLLSLPPSDKAESGQRSLLPRTMPQALVMTRFHLLYLYKDRIKAVWPLDAEADGQVDGSSPAKVVWEQVLPVNVNSNPLIGLECDWLSSTYWMYTNNSIYELIISDEDREVWKWYLERHMFDTAVQYAKNPRQKDVIVKEQAEYYFQQKRYLLSASYFSQVTAVPFEDVCLRFMRIGEKGALRVYLSKIAERMFKKREFVQVTMVATWLLEEFLSAINDFQERVSMATYAGEETTVLDESLGTAVEELAIFIEQYREHLDRNTTYNMLLGYDRREEFLLFARLVTDHERIVEYWIAEQDWEKALDVMSQQPKAHLNYKYASILMERAPVQTVNVWMRQQHLNPRELIPAILTYNKNQSPDRNVANQAIRYLEYVVGVLKNRDPAIHNLLLSLYVQKGKENDRSQDLVQFLGQENHAYSLDYALRLCLRNELPEACVYLYGEMAMYEEAVELAIVTGDLELAKLYADRPMEDSVLRKKLWLKIAQHVVEKEQNVKKAMEFLQKRDLLRIEDILPCFPDFVVIDDFKEELCEALEEYNAQIEELKVEMDEATRSAERLREDVLQVNKRFIVVTPHDRCSLCRKHLMAPQPEGDAMTSGPSGVTPSAAASGLSSAPPQFLQSVHGSGQFYVFPCRHFFHADCLISRVIQLLPARQGKRISELDEAITVRTRQLNEKVPGLVGSFLRGPRSFLPWGDDAASAGLGGGVSGDVKSVSNMKEELDTLVAGECFLCGSMMIRTIDMPFIDDDEMDDIASWAV